MRVALALAADAVAAVVAQRGGGVVGPAAGLQVTRETQILRRALALSSKVIRRTLADAALVSSHPVALRTVLLVAEIARLLTVALANHFKIHDYGLVDADRVDLECLLPLSGVLRALDYLDLGGEHYLSAHLQAGAFVGLAGRSVREAGGEVTDTDAAGGVVLHFYGAGYGLVLGPHQLYHVARVVAQSACTAALYCVCQLIVDVELLVRHRKDQVNRVLLHLVVDLRDGGVVLQGGV